ncbi:MAG: 3-deoxy-8-phosphooctulonate synthase [Candidatus Omnitrophota bacterium]
MSVHLVKIGDISVGPGKPLVLIAGPCVIESQDSVMRHAVKIKKICDKLKIKFIFKSSYDKANRTSLSSFRGPGIIKGLKILAKVRAELGVPILSDVHNVNEAKEAGEVLDCLQIPAFLSRQTDLAVAVAKTGKVVNIKKGQFLAPWNMEEVIRKVEANDNRQILLTERGVCFGYNNLVVDLRSLYIMRQFGYPVVFDATHSVQLPGAKGECSAGERQYVAALSRAAVAFGCDALFLEVHENPNKALCDGSNMVSLKELEKLLSQVKNIDKIVLANKVR